MNKRGEFRKMLRREQLMKKAQGTENWVSKNFVYRIFSIRKAQGLINSRDSLGFALLK
jgi:hypothetical protein